MSISNDYLDEASEVSVELFSAIKQALENDTVIKTARIYAKFHANNDLSQGVIETNFSCSPVTNDKAPSDAEIFELFKAMISLPVNENNAEEIGLTDEQLLAHRDPKGIRDLPLDSEQVQAMIADLKQPLEGLIDPYLKVKEAYLKVIKNLRERNAKNPLTLDHLDITVVYVKKSDQSTDLTFSKTAK